MIHPPDLRKVLVLRLSSIGDIVLATPFLRRLRAVHPAVEIHFGVRKEFAELVRHHPAVSQCIPIDTTKGRNELHRINYALSLEGYDVVFDLHNNHRTRVLRNGLTARLHVINKHSIRRFLFVRLKWTTLDNFLPVPEKYIRTGARYGLAPDSLGTEIHVPDTTAITVNTALSRVGLDEGERCIAICPGARHATKRWPIESFAALTDLILDGTNKRVVVLGGTEDAPLGAVLAQRHPRVVNLCGAFSLLETASAMDRCDAVVANDSGLMHMATARAVPVAAVFGSTVKELGFFPYHATARVLEVADLSCRPCSHIGLPACPKRHFHCMRLVTPASVWQAVRDLLDSNGVDGLCK
jgi:lipopolysaccharide heptosyltransferase II